MLQQVLEYIHNYFIKSAKVGNFEIDDNGMISPLDFLKEGQRFWVTNSDLNDGVYTYHASGIKDDDDITEVGLRAESFAGTVCALAVPPAVIALAQEISDWVENNSEAVTSPYQSESFNGYSYSLKSGGSEGGSNTVLGWKDIYKTQLDRWRRVSL